ncbi:MULTISPECIES: HpcH/HpaI aldolase family protein [Bradyrhizobium]|nr:MULTISPECIES: aldolase/citrate lyase family protein [Bradyrhizobium]MCG2628263.1 aldolase/citrate lyase family protein [Bradyrhizobium zhengyangense]MCG2643382.1 aldolase/citrate lyase family protein [Bradyrhizobium zhengyangense]MCG2670304.1 aldolase/citrate lyase family protein [Bradyrhizobium zhengyangense]MDN4985962.1 aldolase/citrate lyase family protein [Bradyrhizobium sp. WYCCWR 13022]MDN5002658.1 aldolase/citrate lyase family protein [Bradyrhizobium sp. WYCCWR 12677]
MAENGHLLNGYCAIPDAFSAELYARQGFDVITLDLQHGLIGYDAAVAMLQAITAVDVLPLVRIPWLDPAIIMKALDAGALGVTCPMVNTAADAERLVQYCKYPPMGQRSLGPVRAATAYGEDYAAHANRELSVIAMIETAEAVANIESILDVPGLDGVYIGPGDLSLSLNRKPQLEEFDTEVDAAIDRVLKGCIKKGLIAGIFAPGPEQAWRMVTRGFRFVTLSTDARALAFQAKSWVEKFRLLSREPSRVTGASGLKG